MAQKKNIVVRQTRSSIGRPPQVLATLRALGLGRIGKECNHTLSPALLGMISRVKQLVSVREP